MRRNLDRPLPYTHEQVKAREMIQALYDRRAQDTLNLGKEYRVIHKGQNMLTLVGPRGGKCLVAPCPSAKVTGRPELPVYALIESSGRKVTRFTFIDGKYIKLQE